MRRSKSLSAMSKIIGILVRHPEWEVPKVRRREFIAILGSALAARPLVVCAQQPEKIARIGFLGLGSASTFANLVDGLRTGLRDLGYVEGNNIVH